MALTKEQKELLALLKTKEGKQALAGDDGEELAGLMEAIEVGDDDTMESMSKKQQTQLGKIVKYFTKKITEAESSAVEKATADSRKTEDAKIQKFSDSNPGMKNDRVVALMQPLYDKGESLEDSYKIACKALDLDATTGETPVEGDEKEKPKEAKAKATKEKKPVSSIKSVISDDAGDVITPPEEKAAPLTLAETLSANSAAYIAKNGNPFGEQE